jgi:cyclopropane-fatty-acyl-phospholipid synthase
MIDFLLSRNLLPDAVVRSGIRCLLAQRLRDETALYAPDRKKRLAAFTEELARLPIAVNTRESREQHYEVPTEFYQRVLGPRMKYSCGFFDQGDETLAAGEEAMLRLYEERAKLADGQDVLELGCGWGSLSLWMAERFPASRITGVSHSRTQKAFIDAEAARRGLGNLRIVTCDMNDYVFEPGRFDRVVSVEMFEHMKNWARLFAGVAETLRPGGRFFLHIFTHWDFAYHFVARDGSDWMSRYFFTGGMMPDRGLVDRVRGALRLDESWTVNGRHYQRTAELWLQNMDAAAAELRPIFERTYGRDRAKWWSYWRVFFLSCGELWGYRDGKEWTVNHYALDKQTQ